jgi:hypothetical protein
MRFNGVHFAGIRFQGYRARTPHGVPPEHVNPGIAVTRSEMNPDLLRRAALAGCLVMAAGIALLQLVIPPVRVIPWWLFAIFVGVWLFGALMLWLVPWFGAAGTAAWGVLAAVQAYRTHESLSPGNIFLIVGGLVVAALATGFLVTRNRVPRRGGVGDA